ncbi:MAG: cobyric acid synthase [Corynebacterium sp.]|nr:cobyric acid synthase [Corynebacterium sp.]
MPTILIAGTSSDAGKSLVVAGLCRALKKMGHSVAPFKAQNMSNNSAVCKDGEIGRAQALQAYAAGLEPSVDFNPILLKPGSDRRSQLVVRGKAQNTVGAKDYIQHRAYLREIVAESLAALEATYDWVVIEGAGSPAEINLRATDIANLGIPEVPVYIVGDIDRGGVLAHLFGTHQILGAEDQARIKGFIINKFRGDESILAPGLGELEERTGVPTIAVLPWIDGLWIDAEDSLQSQVGQLVGPPKARTGFSIAAVRLPRISNATDVEAFAAHPDIAVRWVDDPQSVRDADLVILPGSKATVDDLSWLRERGIAQALQERQGPILGICGGFQMMCRRITDPVECHDEVEGLGIFDCEIVFEQDKVLAHYEDGSYEIHHGRVHGEEPPYGPVWGTHRHGWFEDDERRREYLAMLGFEAAEASFVEAREQQVELLAHHVEKLAHYLVAAHQKSGQQ